MRDTFYRVRFYRTLLNDCGAARPCILDAVEVRRARSLERALIAAMRRFERRHRLLAWDHLAHGYVIEEVSLYSAKGRNGGSPEPYTSPDD